MNSRRVRAKSQFSRPLNDFWLAGSPAAHPVDRMRRMISAVLPGVLILLASGACTVRQIQSPHAAPVLLEGASAECAESKRLTQWFFGFGAIPVTGVESKELFPSNDATYRVREASTVWDLVITGLLGPFTSVSRQHIIVERCDGARVFVREDQKEDFLRDLSAKQKEELRLAARDEADRMTLAYVEAQGQVSPAPVVILQSGEMLQGPILRISEKELELRVEARFDASGGLKSDAAADAKLAETEEAAEVGETQTSARNQVREIILDLEERRDRAEERRKAYVERLEEQRRAAERKARERAERDKREGWEASSGSNPSPAAEESDSE